MERNVYMYIYIYIQSFIYQLQICLYSFRLLIVMYVYEILIYYKLYIDSYSDCSNTVIFMRTYVYIRIYIYTYIYIHITSCGIYIYTYQFADGDNIGIRPYTEQVSYYILCGNSSQEVLWMKSIYIYIYSCFWTDTFTDVIILNNLQWIKEKTR